MNHYSKKTRLLQAAAGTAAAAILFAAWPGAARAAITPEDTRIFENGPAVIGYLKISAREVPGAGREDVVRIDNERRLAEKLARWEASKDAAEPEPEVDPAPEMTYLGSWKVTGYDLCARCCGNTRGLTASGEKAKVGVTCAGPKSLPFGTRIWIDGIGERVVQDRGGAVNGQHIDVLCNNHDECYALTGSYNVWLIEEGNS